MNKKQKWQKCRAGQIDVIIYYQSTTGVLWTWFPFKDISGGVFEADLFLKIDQLRLGIWNLSYEIAEWR